MRELSKKVIGITGNIAVGKSAVVDYLKMLDYPIIDTDLITQDIYLNDSYFKAEMIKLFGTSIIKDNQIDKKEVAKLVFNDKEKLDALNKLAHPLIKTKTRQLISEYDGLIFVDIPLLYEAKFEDMVAKVILVVANEDVQLDRLIKRNNLSKTDALKRINSQLKQDVKKAYANYVIENNTSLKVLYQQVNSILLDLERVV